MDMTALALHSAQMPATWRPATLSELPARHSLYNPAIAPIRSLLQHPGAAMLRQGLQQSARRLQGALLRLASSSAAAEQQPLAIPAEVAQLVSLRGGLAALPAAVEAAVDQVAAGARSVAAHCLLCNYESSRA